jgi:uncharacterized protein (DUF983 family)
MCNRCVRSAKEEESEKCPKCGKNNLFSGAKKGCEVCKQKLKDEAVKIESEGPREQMGF